MTWPVEHRVTSRERRAEILEERTAWRVGRGGPPKGYPENLELLQAVIDHPDDDAPRHAYAKWMRDLTPRTLPPPNLEESWRAEVSYCSKFVVAEFLESVSAEGLIS